MLKTIKIIDLLVLIANKEYDKLPKKIKWNNVIYKFIKEANNYMPYGNYVGYDIFYEVEDKLNEEVEIIEDEEIPKEIGKMDFTNGVNGEFTYSRSGAAKIMEDKIEELTKAVNYLLKKDKEV